MWFSWYVSARYKTFLLTYVKIKGCWTQRYCFSFIVWLCSGPLCQFMISWQSGIAPSWANSSREFRVNRSGVRSRWKSGLWHTYQLLAPWAIQSRCYLVVQLKKHVWSLSVAALALLAIQQSLFSKSLTYLAYITRGTDLHSASFQSTLRQQLVASWLHLICHNCLM